MAPRSAAVLAACFAACIPMYADSADPVPAQTGAFVTYCAGHLADCKDKVVTTDVATLAGIAFAKSGAQDCTVPKGVSEDEGTKQILAWLGKHKEVANMKTPDGIQAAEKDLWHCVAQVGDGTEPGGPPAKTGAYVAYCATHYADCANEMVAVTVAVMVPDPPQHCSPPDSVTTKQMYDAVLPWLKLHPETYALDTDDGIMAAFDHVWPCH